MNQQQRIALFVLVLAGFVTIFDLFVVNVAIVSIERGLQASFTELTLIIAGYELAFGLLLITGGRLGDIYGRRRLYQAGMAFFTLASLLCAVAPTALLLVIARFIQGLAGRTVIRCRNYRISVTASDVTGLGPDTFQCRIAVYGYGSVVLFCPLSAAFITHRTNAAV
ncbi:MFS transporter [Morganella morganii]|uniref:MFS transporter n=1 Tax=Morganella morganii TaxID=582 RepID=UPI003B244325